MTNVLLQQLTSQDFQWIKQNGDRQKIDSGVSLIRQKEEVNQLYIILKGEFAAVISQKSEGGALASAFAALEDNSQLERDIARLGEGEIMGVMSFLDLSPAASNFTAIENSLVLVIPHEKLRNKFKQDFGLSARFYRAVAILLTERFTNLVNLYLRNRLGKINSLQDVPLLFGELKDSDVDWLANHGVLQKFNAGQRLIQVGRLVENLYIILQGKMSLLVSEVKQNQIASIFAALEQNDEDPESELEREIAQLSRGEIIGETVAFDSYLSPASLKTQENSLVLVIPKQELLLKLQKDPAMAARFYRVISIMLSGRIQGLICRLGFGKGSYKFGQTLSENAEYEDEIDLSVMDNIWLGGARFDWMLKKLRVS